jgi:hypothetical protein
MSILLSARAEELPKAISMPAAVYPQAARELKAEGKVLIEFTLDDKGQVDSAKVLLTSGSDLLDAAALDAVMSYQFEPVKYLDRNHKPVYKKAIYFSLDGGAGGSEKDSLHGTSTSKNNKLEGDTEPKIIEITPTIYPDEARRAEIEGVVILELSINADGKLESAKVIKSSNYEMLDAAALETVKNWKFSPAIRSGQKVSEEKGLNITFKLTPDVEEELAKTAYKECDGDASMKASIAQILDMSHAKELTNEMQAYLQDFLSSKFDNALKANSNNISVDKQKTANEIKRKLKDAIHSELDWDKLKPVYFNAYCAIYTKDELDGISQFYQSPTGQAMLKKQPQVGKIADAQMHAIYLNLRKRIEEVARDAVWDMAAARH